MAYLALIPQPLSHEERGARKAQSPSPLGRGI
ncbi:MAG: hypothetical protein RLZZ597_1042 [Cyanobacteriota bacterium]|jgi:hypothetical protein